MFTKNAENVQCIKYSAG